MTELEIAGQDTQDNIVLRAKRVKEIVEELEKAGKRPSQNTLRKIEFFPLNTDKVLFDFDQIDD